MATDTSKTVQSSETAKPPVAKLKDGRISSTSGNAQPTRAVFTASASSAATRTGTRNGLPAAASTRMTSSVPPSC